MNPALLGHSLPVLTGEVYVSQRVDSLERFQALSRSQLRDWLTAHHLTSQGIWLITYRRVSGRPRPSYADVVEELLCFGWIDSRLRRLDEERTMLLCTPRSPTSQWSKSNKARVERLTREGLMQPSGLEAVAAAKRSGTWDYLNDVENLVEPADVTSALGASGVARRNWDAAAASYRRRMLYWIQSAGRASTRAVRIRAVVDAAAANERIDAATATVRARAVASGREAASRDAYATMPSSCPPEAGSRRRSRQHT